METGKQPIQGNCIDIRFSLIYSILILIVSALLALIAYISKGDDKVIKYMIYGMALLSLIHGIYAISGGKCVRYDPEAKRIKIFGFMGLTGRSILFDKLTFEGNDLYREVNGKRRYVNLMRYQCKREDFRKFIDTVKQKS